MGLFGLFYTGIVLACKGGIAVQNSVTDIKQQVHAENTNNLTYRDHRGCLRMTSNGKPVYYANTSVGDRVLKYNDGSVAVNFSEDYIQERLQKFKDQVEKENDQICVKGRFVDVYPERYRKGYWFYCTGREVVYDYHGQSYFCDELQRNDMPKYLFTRIDDGEQTILYQQFPQLSELQKRYMDGERWLDKENEYNKKRTNIPKGKYRHMV